MADSIDELREKVKELLWDIALSDENDDNKEADKVIALITTEQLAILERLLEHTKGKAVGVPVVPVEIIQAEIDKIGGKE